jgi:hypothetical protein
MGGGLGSFLSRFQKLLEALEAAHAPPKSSLNMAFIPFMYGCHDFGMRNKQLALFYFKLLTRCVDNIRSYTENMLD